MQAAVFVGPGTLEVQDRPEPAPERPDDVVVEVEGCGICGTDLHILEVPPGHPARPGVILGHEIVGRVVAAGPEAASLEGARVAVDPEIRCGSCARCRSGDPSNCERLRALGVDVDGGLADLCTVPAGIVYRIAEETATESAALIEPLACALNGFHRIAPRPGETALIAGGGPIGGLFLKLLRAAGVSAVAVSDPLGPRREAATALGADLVLDPRDAPVGEAIEAAWGGRPSIVIDAAGSALPDAVPAAADGGRILLFGMNESARGEISQYDITRRELTIVGSYISRYTFAEAVALIDRGVIDPGDLVTHTVGLDDVEDGIELLRTGEALKVVVKP